MPKVLETYRPLRLIREGLNDGKGASAQQIADRLVAKLNEMGLQEDEKTYAWILRIEERGTRDRYIIKGLAAIYNRPEDEIALAALPPANKITECCEIA